jgi:hypothetical protein
MDLTIRLPWINRRRPFVSLHVAPFPGYRIRNGRSYKYFHCGIIWGRQFMPNCDPPYSWWFDFPPEHVRALIASLRKT